MRMDSDDDILDVALKEMEEMVGRSDMFYDPRGMTRGLHVNGNGVGGRFTPAPPRSLHTPTPPFHSKENGTGEVYNRPSTHRQFSPPVNGDYSVISNLVSLVERLRLSCVQISDVREVSKHISPDTKNFLKQFANDVHNAALTPSTPSSISPSATLPSNGVNGGSHHYPACPTLPEEGSAISENHVAVLQEQVEAQRERISELEREKTSQLSSAHKLDLMAEISRQKMYITSLETEKVEYRSEILHLNETIGDLRLQLLRYENELTAIKKHLSSQGSNDRFGAPENMNGNGMLPAATSTPIAPNNIPVSRVNGEQVGTYGDVFYEMNVNSDNNMDRLLAYQPPSKSNSMGELRAHQVGGFALPSVSSAYPPLKMPRSQSLNRTPQVGVRDYNRPYMPDKFNPGIIDEDDVSTGTNSDKQSSGKLKLFDRKSRRRPNSRDFDPGMLPSGIIEGRIPSSSSSEGFQRGGHRSTAGPRLGLQWNSTKQDDFSNWDSDHVCAWLHQLGLGEYVTNCRRWIKHGSQLMRATRKEIEKELAIRHPLHLKKIQVHLRSMRYNNNEQMPLSPTFTLPRWLDDIGLLQHLSVFMAAAVDMRVIESLTMDDLQTLKITNELHALSLKRGIQLLRSIDFDLNRLRRRPTETSESPSPLEVCLWSHHQVVEWLRKIELPEFASNLRGSGVHGAIMILEPRFTADVLASVLNIAESKSLLRRHLTSHFHQLVGIKVQQTKMEAARSLPLLTVTAKMKPIKKKTNLFSRKSRNELEIEELVCPRDLKSSLVDLQMLSKIQEVQETEIDDGNERAVLDKLDESPSTNV